jgi:hypothetical protein
MPLDEAGAEGIGVGAGLEVDGCGFTAGDPPEPGAATVGSAVGEGVPGLPALGLVGVTVGLSLGPVVTAEESAPESEAQPQTVANTRRVEKRRILHDAHISAEPFAQTDALNLEKAGFRKSAVPRQDSVTWIPCCRHFRRYALLHSHGMLR